MLPGAILAAVVWQLMQVFGAAYVAGVVKELDADVRRVRPRARPAGVDRSSSPSASCSASRSTSCAAKRLYPRALLTPFTDDVDLTSADQRAYADAARAQRHKGFEDVAVTFEHDGQNRSARRRARADADIDVDADVEPT